MANHGTKPDPTPAQIRERAAAIRAGWSEKVLAERWQGRVSWAVPRIRVADVQAVFVEEMTAGSVYAP